MSWEESRPVTGKLPTNSGNWQGNQTVETLTGYWDDFLVGIKDRLDSAEFISEQADDQYLDFIGSGLCGFGKAWDTQYPIEVKRKLIQNFPSIMKSRGSRQSIESLLNCVVPGSKLIHYQIPRSDFAKADFSVVSDYPVTRFMICLPNNLERDGREFRWVRKLIDVFMPIAEVSLQYVVNLPGKTLAGDWSIN